MRHYHKTNEARTEYDCYIRLIEAIILQSISDIDSQDVPNKDEMPAWEFMQLDGYDILALLGFNIGGGK